MQIFLPGLSNTGWIIKEQFQFQFLFFITQASSIHIQATKAFLLKLLGALINFILDILISY